MKSALILPLLAAAATAQLLSEGNGQLPSCAQNCPVLNNAVTSCNGATSLSLGTWSCFCQTVYHFSGNNPAAICPSTCTAATDEADVTSWFTANCGSDNGQGEHNGGPGTATTSGAGSQSTGGSSGFASNGGSSQNIGDNGCSGGWWKCHYQWIIMILVLAVGFVALGFGARWLKKRHDLKRDQISGGFNSGITSRQANYTDDKMGPARSGTARTADASMPYGYNYSRSESSRLEQEPATAFPGSSRDVEKGDGSSGGVREKMKRVMVRERDGR